MTAGGTAAAQTPGDAGAGAQRGGSRAGNFATDNSGPAGPGMAAIDRAVALQRFGLHDPALNLTDAQRAQIDKAADAYVAEMGKIRPPEPGARPSADSSALRTRASENLVAVVNRILTSEQKRAWEASPTVRRLPNGPRSSQ